MACDMAPPVVSRGSHKQIGVQITSRNWQTDEPSLDLACQHIQCGSLCVRLLLDAPIKPLSTSSLAC